MKTESKLFCIYSLILILTIGACAGSGGGNGGEPPQGAPEVPSEPPIVIITPEPPEEEIEPPLEDCVLIWEGNGNAYGIVGRHDKTKTIKTKDPKGDSVYIDETGLGNNPHVTFECE